MKDSISKNRIISSTLYLSFFLVLAFGWILISTYYDNDLIFPSFNQIFKAFINIFKDSESLKALGYTILRVIISVIICFLIAFMIIIIYIICPNSISFFKPLIQIMRSTPLAILSIFIFIIIGDKLGPYLITILMSLPVTFEGLFVAINEIDKDIIDEVSTLEGSKMMKISKIYIPIISPYIMMTLIQTLGMSFKVMIMGEYICQTKNSIGKILYSVKSLLEMDYLIAYGIIIIAIVSLIEFGLKKIKKRYQ